MNNYEFHLLKLKDMLILHIYQDQAGIDSFQEALIAF